MERQSKVCLKLDKTKKHRFTFILMMFFVLFCTLAYGQQKQIKGVIKDSNTGESIPGVNVMIKGTSVGTVSDMDGKYEITVPDSSSVLVFSFMGYLAESISVGSSTLIDVNLAADLKTLDEVVVVGYGTMRKSDVTGAIVSIDEKDFQQVKTINVIESLQGKAAGVDITHSSGEAGSGFSILIRGTRSLSGGNSPLYIVDGVEYGSGIDVNPNDIKSIEILKDISSTAIYGTRGANGVVIITTKKGTESKPKIHFSTYIGANNPLGSLPYMDRESYLKYKEDLAKTKIYNSTKGWPDSVDVSYQPFEEEGIANGTDTKWLDLITRTGYLKNAFLSVSGGSPGIAYNVSVDYTNEIGMLKQDDYKRYVLKGGLDVKATKFLNVGLSSILSYKDRSRMSFPEKEIRLMNPLAVPYDSIGNLLVNPTVSSTLQTPLWYYQDGYYNKQELTTRIFSNIYADFQILKGLNFRTSFNADIKLDRNGSSERAGVEDVNVSMFISPSKDLTWTNLLTFNRTFGVHRLLLTAGHELQKGNTERYGVNGRNPAINNSLWYALTSMEQESIGIDIGDDVNFTEGSLLSFFGRINYSLKGKYVATASLRYDGSSRLAPGHKWDYFPSVSLAWNASEENFIQSVESISLLKLRLGYGTSGSSTVPVYSSKDKLNVNPLYYEFGTNEAVYYGYRPLWAGNDELGWEKTTSYNLGVDFGIFQNRISGNIDIYKAITNDNIQKRALPAHAALPFIYDNIGQTQNKGVEIMVHTINVHSRGNGFKWTSDISFTRNKEEITEIATGVLKDELNGWFVGYPVSVYYDYEKTGIWQLTDSVEMSIFTANKFKYGDIKIKDQNNDSTINEEDRVILGTNRPKWYGSWNNTFEYKGFDLSIMIMARMGQMITDNIMNMQQVRDDYAESGMVVDYWTPVNPTNVAPRLDPSVSAIGYMPYASSLRYTDGSWIKVRDLTLGYSLPSGILNKFSASSLRVYVSAKNAFVIYSPFYSRGRYDPEKGGSTSWPTPKTYIIGLTLEF